MDKADFLDHFSFGVEEYREAHKGVPNAVVVSDRTMQFLYEKSILRNKGREHSQHRFHSTNSKVNASKTQFISTQEFQKKTQPNKLEDK